MEKRIALIGILLGTLAAGGVQMLSYQDVDEQAEQAAREAAAAAAAARRANEQAQRDEKAWEQFLKRGRDQSEANLDRAIVRQTQEKKTEKERKFKALDAASKELMDLSVKTFNQVHKNGDQSVSVSLFVDLNRMEQLVKEIRKNAK